MEDYTEIFAWGLDNCGQLGLGTSSRDKKYPSPLFCSFNIIIREMSCGEDHSCFISDLGHVYSMGNNLNGKLGINDKTKLYSSSPVLVEALSSYECVKVSCGWTHTAAITKDFKLFTWGCGEFGALGLGRSEDVWAPVEIFSDVKDVSCGSRHTGIVRNSSLYMCGAGEMGQLGTGRRQSENLFTLVSQNEVRSVSCGVFHSGFVTQDGEIWLMGGNSYGQLGTGNKKSAISPVKVNLREVVKLVCGFCTACICNEGFFVWGTSALGEYLIPKKVKISNSPIIDVCLGGSFAVAIDSKNLFSWGNNSNGELGLGDLETRNNANLVSGLSGKKIKKIAAGGNFVICLGQEVRSKGKDYSKASKTTREWRNEMLSERKIVNPDDVLKPKENLIAKNDLESQVSILRQENAQLKESLNWYKNQANYEKPKIFEEAFQELKESYISEIKNLKTQLDSQVSLQRALENDLQLAISHSSRLEKTLNETQPRFLINEKRYFGTKDFHSLEEQKTDLQVSLETSKLQIKDLMTANSSLVQENSYLKQSLSDLQQESIKLANFVTELQGSVDGLNGVLNNQEMKICMLTKKNSELEQEVLKMHEKNEEVVCTFEREVSQRARQYRDKTLSILKSQKNRNLTPEDGPRSSRNELSKGQLDKIKNAVHRMIETDSVSPVRTASPNLRSPYKCN